MRIVVMVGLALGMAACRPKDDGLVDPLPDAGDCTNDVGLEADTSEYVQADGSVQIFGSARARDGVTIRAVYVGGVPVALTEFNYRGWNVRIPPDRVMASVEGGIATLDVVAYTSAGCAALVPSIRVVVSDAGTPDDDASAQDAGSG